MTLLLLLLQQRRQRGRQSLPVHHHHWIQQSDSTENGFEYQKYVQTTVVTCHNRRPS